MTREEVSRVPFYRTRDALCGGDRWGRDMSGRQAIRGSYVREPWVH